MEEYVTTSDQSTAGSDRREDDSSSGPQRVSYQEGVSADLQDADSRGSEAELTQIGRASCRERV